MSTTAQQVVTAAKAREIHATEVPEDARNHFPVVNFWAPYGRVIATLTWPDPSRPQFNTFAWGHHYEHTAPPDTDAETLVQLVIDSGVMEAEES